MILNRINDIFNRCCVIKIQFQFHAIGSSDDQIGFTWIEQDATASSQIAQSSQFGRRSNAESPSGATAVFSH